PGRHAYRGRGKFSDAPGGSGLSGLDGVSAGIVAAEMRVRSPQRSGPGPGDDEVPMAIRGDRAVRCAEIRTNLREVRVDGRVEHDRRAGRAVGAEPLRVKRRRRDLIPHDDRVALSVGCEARRAAVAVFDDVIEGGDDLSGAERLAGGVEPP